MDVKVNENIKYTEYMFFLSKLKIIQHICPRRLMEKFSCIIKYFVLVD